MFKPNKKDRGALLAGAIILSGALGIAMVALITSSRQGVHQAESLLARENLRRMAEEKFMRDMLSLKQNAPGLWVSTDPVSFAWGQAQSALDISSVTLGDISAPLYLVVTATLTSTSQNPGHLRLEVILDEEKPEPLSLPPLPVPSSRGRPASVEETIEDQLRALLGDDESIIAQAKKDVLSELASMFGSNVGDMVIMVETNQYRNPASAEEQRIKTEEKDSFVLEPVSVIGPKKGPSIRLWKETYD